MSAHDRDALLALERAHVWPPYTSLDRHDESDLLVVAEAEGSWLVDVDGRRFFDATGSWWTCTLGHRHPRLVSRLREQAGKLLHVAAGSATHPEVAQLARELCAVAPPGLVRAHFSDDGSTSVEVAVKLAFQYWQLHGRPTRTRFVALSGAYHGDTTGAMSLASIEEFRGAFGPLLFHVLWPPHPEECGGWDRVLSALREVLTREADSIAGVIVEPLVQGASGMRMHAPAVLAEVAAQTRAIDAFLIADEVFTGYGRVGTMWACEQAGVRPDLLCVAKGFTAGVLPMAATLASQRIVDGFRGPGRVFMHGHTFCGHALGASIAREVLAIYRDEHVLEGLPSRSALLAEAATRLLALPAVRATRALGAILAIDLGEVGYGGSGRGARAAEALRARGVHARPLGDTLYLTPRLNIPEVELRWVLEVYEDALCSLDAAPRSGTDRPP